VAKTTVLTTSSFFIGRVIEAENGCGLMPRLAPLVSSCAIAGPSPVGDSIMALGRKHNFDIAGTGART